MTCCGAGSNTTYYATAGPDGSFRFESVPPGEAEVRATVGNGRPGGKGAVVRMVPAGTSDLVLVVPRGRALRLRVRGIPAGRTAAVRVTGPTLPYQGVSEVVEADGVLEIPDLPADANVAALVSVTEPRLLWGRVGVKAGGPPIDAFLAPAARITGRILASEGMEAHGLSIRAPFRRWLEVGADGTFSVEDVPEGVWPIEVGWLKGEEWGEKTFEARAGEQVTIDLHGE